ncbi:RNA methyltransferase [Chryseolinea sp. H1M3-3]|uniref:TrmH family RNA methyltransferase n=1 Tax=Chryseolinea sp. H1M3-3 TaxID=3034144 RepID=UPI0023EBBC53|nr:RNA methyltransferase [Chryseolinea sp. H1M3-3]
MHPLITSVQNPKIKNILALEKARERNKQNLCVIEGIKELSLAVAGAYKISSVFYCPEIIESDEVQTIVKDDQLLIPVQQNVFSKLAYRESTGGIIALAEQKKHALETLELTPKPLLLVLEGVEKPGNLGAVLRTADAAGIDGVIICDPRVDFYNPNVIRSSVGCVFTNQIASATSAETIAWLKRKNIAIFCTYLKASKPYDDVDYTPATAIVMGTESVGLSDSWVENANENIIIPMQGKIDSMNVSTAAAVVIFEARRQRGFKEKRYS